MSVTMVALLWGEDSEKELLGKGFIAKEVYLKYSEVALSEEGLSKALSEVFTLSGNTPYQFAVAPYWEGDKKAGVVQIALCLREGTEVILESRGFKKAIVMGKHGSNKMTDEATPDDEQEFLSMKHLPKKWYASSFWGAGY